MMELDGFLSSRQHAILIDVDRVLPAPSCLPAEGAEKQCKGLYLCAALALVVGKKGIDNTFWG